MKKVLVVEDSAVIANAIKIILESAGIEVDAVNSGEAAVSLSRQNAYDLAIVDLMMPEMTGDEVFRKFRMSKKTKDMPVMILTAKADALKYDKRLESCDKFMTKPFDKSDLLVQVKALLKI